MTATVPAPSPDTAQAELDFTDPGVVASYLELAAARIKAFGKANGDWWHVTDPATGFPLTLGDYQDGRPTCTVGAIAVQLGYRTNKQVLVGVCGLSAEDNDADRRPPHPVVAALMRELGYAEVENVFAWSDGRRDDQIVDQLRAIASELRTRAVA